MYVRAEEARLIKILKKFVSNLTEIYIPMVLYFVLSFIHKIASD